MATSGCALRRGRASSTSGSGPGSGRWSSRTPPTPSAPIAPGSTSGSIGPERAIPTRPAMPAAIRFVGGLHEDACLGHGRERGARPPGPGPVVGPSGFHRPDTMLGSMAGAPRGRRPQRRRGGAAAGRADGRGPNRGPGAGVPGEGGGGAARRRSLADARTDQRPALQPARGVRVARGATRGAGARRPFAEIAPRPAAPGLTRADRGSFSAPAVERDPRPVDRGGGR